MTVVTGYQGAVLYHSVTSHVKYSKRSLDHQHRTLHQLCARRASSKHASHASIRFVISSIVVVHHRLERDQTCTALLAKLRFSPRPPLPASRAQSRTAPSALPWKPAATPFPAPSSLPASLPMLKPALKLNAESTTTTPADTTQVSSVGDTNSSSALLERRTFFTMRRSLLDARPRLSHLALSPLRSGEVEVVVVECRRSVGRKIGAWRSKAGELAGKADSGIRRNAIGSILLLR